MNITGKIILIGETQLVSEKFQKREIVIEYAENPTYPEQILFEATQEKVDLLDNFNVGDTVEVHFNLRGRPVTMKDGSTRYFNNLVLWRINAADAQENVPNASAGVLAGMEDDSQDLPF